VGGTPVAAAGVADTPPRAELSDRALVAITALVTLPLLWMGYGTDIDVTDVLTTAAGIRDGDYRPSRPPGAPVFEAIAAVLDPVGGHLLLNLATAAAGAATVVGIARLVRTWGHRHGDLVALAFLASPATIIAATSTGDFVWALAFFLWGVLAHLKDRPWAAGVLFALALGTRLSSLFLLAAFLVADGWDPPNRRRCVRTGAIAVAMGALLYVPAWLAADRSLDFLQTTSGWRSFANNLGRFAYKNYVTGGALFLVLVLVSLPALIAALRRWGSDPMVRASVLGLAVTEFLFFLLPWKYNHLLPCLVMVLLWLAASRRNTRGFWWLVIGALAINGLVTFRPLAPDRPAEASSGRWDPALVAGLLVNDVDCRLEAMREPLQDLNGDAWPCTLKPMRGSTDGADDAGPG
jgi:Glycosyltransferase family 87